MDVGEDVGQNVAMKFDEIWLFIEQKLKTKVPNYFKNILKVCGYNNGITIASIEESDVKYFTEEVRKGNVTNFFNGIDGKTVLEGCNKTAENFEFTRGHEQFLLSIAKYVKKHLDDNGPDSFILSPEQAPEALTLVKTKPKNIKIAVLPQKTRMSEVQSIAESTVTVHVSNQELQPSKPNNNEISKYKTKLLSKVVTSLRVHTPEMYEKHKEMIKEKIASTLVELHVKSDGQVDVADISCPFCKKTTRAFHAESSNGTRRWNSSNFDRHLKHVHPNQCDNIQIVDIKENVEVPSQKTDKNPNCTVTSEQASESMLISSETAKVVVAVALSPDKISEQTCSRIVERIEEDCKKPTRYASNLVSDSDGEKQCEIIKLGSVDPVARPIVCYSDSDEEGEEEPMQHRIKLNVLKESFNPEKKIVRNQEDEEESILQLKHADKELNVGDYVICVSPIKNSVNWPANTPIIKHFVGQILQIKDCVGKIKLKTAKNSDIHANIELQFLEKHPLSKLNFIRPKTSELSYITRNTIIKILEAPSKNRRGEFVFKDKSILDYIF